MVRDGENSITPLRFWKFRDEVECYCFERKGFWFWVDGLEGRPDRSIIDLMSLTVSASLYKFHHFFPYPGPPIVSLHQSYSAADPWMSVYWGFMVGFDNSAFVVKPPCNHSS